MFVQGIISADRRYVRLNVFPFFFQLGEVFTYTTNLGAVGGGGGLLGGGGGGAQNTPVTLQFPIMATTTVLTTVNVPDGGYRIGGVKRVNEGRTEAGVPILNKLPYVNRLFKNVGTGRETQSLMIMVHLELSLGKKKSCKELLCNCSHFTLLTLKGLSGNLTDLFLTQKCLCLTKEHGLSTRQFSVHMLHELVPYPLAWDFRNEHNSKRYLLLP